MRKGPIYFEIGGLFFQPKRPKLHQVINQRSPCNCHLIDSAMVKMPFDICKKPLSTYITTLDGGVGLKSPEHQSTMPSQDRFYHPSSKNLIFVGGMRHRQRDHSHNLLPTHCPSPHIKYKYSKYYHIS